MLKLKKNNWMSFAILDFGQETGLELTLPTTPTLNTIAWIRYGVWVDMSGMCL